jgi:NAD(P)-dependent dehydrogenase (short-subunit alcohol dehydrogenase family)
MKVLITGTRGLASALGNAYVDHSVTLVSQSRGYNIHDIQRWGTEFLDHDCVFNCAYDEFGQVTVLEFFYQHWKNTCDKQIINIGSRSIMYRRLDNKLGYWPYRQHKQALQSAVDAMLLDAKCDIKIINPGPIDTDMIAHHQCVKYDPNVLAERIKMVVSNPDIKRVDLWL